MHIPGRCTLACRPGDACLCFGQRGAASLWQWSCSRSRAEPHLLLCAAQVPSRQTPRLPCWLNGCRRMLLILIVLRQVISVGRRSSRRRGWRNRVSRRRLRVWRITRAVAADGARHAAVADVRAGMPADGSADGVRREAGRRPRCGAGYSRYSGEDPVLRGLCGPRNGARMWHHGTPSPARSLLQPAVHALVARGSFAAMVPSSWSLSRCTCCMPVSSFEPPV